jgi:pyridoxamine 5'-phosphate oxidase
MLPSQQEVIMEHEKLKIEVLSFANRNPACFLATETKGRPRVRGLLMWFADESGFYFHTATTKDLYCQLRENTSVEAVFTNNSADPAKMTSLRLAGKAEIMDQAELVKKLLTERPWLNSFGSILPDAKPVIFRIINGEAFFWNMGTNLKEKEAPRIRF